MTVIGIETATDVCSVGIVAEGRTMSRSVRDSRIHSEQLLVLLDGAMKEASVGWKDIGGVALSAGPGSFTGLRIGASAVKGLLSAHAAPFALVPTFHGIHAAYREEAKSEGSCIICLDAKQDEWYVQEAGPDGLVEPPRIVTTAVLRDMVKGRTVLTDVPDRFREDAEALDLRRWCSGAMIARLGKEMIEQGKTHDVRTFEPSYWKEFVVRSTPKAVTPRSEAKET